ncbi:hypothetical protein MMC12_005897 [Toensbergia leucococca]|nr:hypothetical protein [Toensbergia leucococca]
MPEIQAETLQVDGNPVTREKQMSNLVSKKLMVMNKEQWRFQIGNESVEIRQQVDRIVKVVLVAKDFISSVASLDPIHAGLPWTGVCLLLPVSSQAFSSSVLSCSLPFRPQLVVNDSKQRTAAIDGLESISETIRRYTEIELLYLQSDERTLRSDLETTITKLYSQVLEYEARAACQFSRNAAVQFARNVVEADNWNDILEKVKLSEIACEKLLRIIDAKDHKTRTKQLQARIDEQIKKVLELLKNSRIQDKNYEKLVVKELNAGRKEQGEWHKNVEESRCYECLRTTDYEFNKNKVPDRIPGTCEWFLQHMKYRNWRDKQTSTWLYVTADPGCGKSVLSKLLVNEYAKRNPTEAVSICYYFFKDDSEENRSANHAMCAILHQLFSQNRNLLRHAMPDFGRNGQKLPQLFDTLWKILLSAAADPESGTIICVLDALDECAEKTRIPLIRELARFYLDPDMASRMKFIVVSRPNTAMADAFYVGNPNVASVQLAGEEESEVQAIRIEIDLVVKERVKQFNSLRRRRGIQDDAYMDVQKRLDKVENRTYLWVSLIFPELDKNAGLARGKLLQVIETLPKSIDEAYQRILVQSSDLNEAKKLLHIVVAATRPLALAEMNIALSIETHSGSIEDLDLEPEAAFKVRLREICGLFITIQDSQIFLIHQTAKEFLVPRLGTMQPSSGLGSCQMGWKNSLEPIESNRILAKICILYILFDGFEPPTYSVSRGLRKRLSNTRAQRRYAEKYIF